MSKATLKNKVMRTVYIGQSPGGSYCGHQHLTPTAARNCIKDNGKVVRLTPAARRKLGNS